ncbi:MAG: tRNA (N6-threonylcarbamoyladenosine(37)-N6)-methyltransferase TrmO [Candidatus Aenigmatarchaeota archaeon]
MKIFFTPIGYVSSSYKTPQQAWEACEKGLAIKTISKILINKKYESGLKGIEKFSHIFVIYYLHKAKKIEIETYPGPITIKELPKIGVFASRSQYRPNKIALRLVKLQKVQKNVLYVKGLDAIDKTPVIDIKPYIKGFDRPKSFKQADWYYWLK